MSKKGVDEWGENGYSKYQKLKVVYLIYRENFNYSHAFGLSWASRKQ